MLCKDQDAGELMTASASSWGILERRAAEERWMDRLHTANDDSDDREWYSGCPCREEATLGAAELEERPLESAERCLKVLGGCPATANDIDGTGLFPEMVRC